MRRTKILVTVGPATQAPAILRQLLSAGADAFRLNFSHGTDAEHRDTLQQLHRVRGDSPVAIIADLQGPKIRLGEFPGGPVEVVAGANWRFSEGLGPGSVGFATVSLPGLSRAARPGDPLLLGDGNVELEVLRASRDGLEARVTHGGRIGPHMGFFLPRARLRADVLGPKDRSDLSVAVRAGIDYLALSFVRDGHDIRRARRELDRSPRGRAVKIIAKIERAEALDHVDEILAEADGIMVARGDLGIEVPLERLALEQKHLLRRATAAGRIGIVATQMLLSMVASPRPTRAEATDVANAVIDGTDAVMLSEETAVGSFPVEATRWLAKICEATEAGLDRGEIARPVPATPPASLEQAVASAAVHLSEERGAAAIVAPTHSGRTARLLSKLHPRAPILALTSQEATRRQLALAAGVYPIRVPSHLPFAELSRAALALARRTRGTQGGPVVLTAGYPVEGRPTNLVTVLDPAVPSGRRRPRSAVASQP